MLHGRSGRFLIVVWMVTLRNGRNRTWLLIQGPPGYSWKSLNSCNVPAFKMEFITVRFFIFGSLCFPKTLFDSKTSSSALARHLFMTFLMDEIGSTAPRTAHRMLQTWSSGSNLLRLMVAKAYRISALFVGPHLSSRVESRGIDSPPVRHIYTFPI